MLGAAGALVLGTFGCASVGSQAGDEEGLAITCDVVDAAGRPVEGAEVLLRLQGVADTAGREERKATPAGGTVAFSYTTGQRSTPYALTVSKSGYETSTVAGVAAAGPGGNRHKVTLLRGRR
jgi:hypothetical protein